MKFVDEARITVQSGKGGPGCVSFRREKFIPKGGPDGGDGGDGGSVLLHASPQKRTLYTFRHQKYLKAQNGGAGLGKQKHGKNGENLVIEIPVGTLVTDAETGAVIHDFITPNETRVMVKGGRGGQGNKRFTTSTHRAPKFAQPGEPPEILHLKLELKLIADVGLIGLPNAGKSTLISVISSARPKIGNYPFTTITPNIGMVKADWGEPFAVADIPGLIEGAHAGVGMGTEFLRHVERTGVLVHVIDSALIDPTDPLKSYQVINQELMQYGRDLAKKEQIIVLNKTDLPGAAQKAKKFKRAMSGRTVFMISAATREGVPQLTGHLAKMVDKIKRVDTH